MRIILGVFETIARFVQKKDTSGARRSKSTAHTPVMGEGGKLLSYGVPIAEWDGDKIKIIRLSEHTATAVRIKHQDWIRLLAEAQGIKFEGA